MVHFSFERERDFGFSQQISGLVNIVAGSGIVKEMRENDQILVTDVLAAICRDELLLYDNQGKKIAQQDLREGSAVDLAVTSFSSTTLSQGILTLECVLAVLTSQHTIELFDTYSVFDYDSKGNPETTGIIKKNSRHIEVRKDIIKIAGDLNTDALYGLLSNGEIAAINESEFVTGIQNPNKTASFIEGPTETFSWVYFQQTQLPDLAYFLNGMLDITAFKATQNFALVGNPNNQKLRSTQIVYGMVGGSRTDRSGLSSEYLIRIPHDVIRIVPITSAEGYFAFGKRKLSYIERKSPKVFEAAAIFDLEKLDLEHLRFIAPSLKFMKNEPHLYVSDGAEVSRYALRKFT